LQPIKVRIKLRSLFREFEMRSPATPSVDQLLVLLTVAEAGSFTAAAKRLGRATSAISYAIDTLESQLGISLFDRGTTRKPKLTQQGEAVVSEARAGGVERVVRDGQARIGVGNLLHAGGAIARPVRGRRWSSGDRSDRRCGRCGATGSTAPTALIESRVDWAESKGRAKANAH
jgi:hypothetical protein